jgi:hypothetical protein
MIGFPKIFSRPPSLKQLSLKRYLVNLSLNRLVLGVDGIHIDVHISTQVYDAVKRAASDLMIKHSRSKHIIEAESGSMIKQSRSENIFNGGTDKKERRDNEKTALKHVCTDVLLGGINKAKSESEVQIDFLGQVALAKLFLEEIQNEYRKLVARFEAFIRTYELSQDFDHQWLKVKEKLTEIKNNQRRIVRLVGEELFQVLADVQAQNLKNFRESNFPAEHILPDNFFINPTLHTDDVTDDFLLVDEYVLFSRLSNDPDNFSSIKSVIEGLFSRTDLGRENTADAELDPRETKEAGILPPIGNVLDPWLMEINNIDLMFNYFHTKAQYKEDRKGKKPKIILLELKSWMKVQENLLNQFYRKFKKSRLIKPIVAAYEMRSVYRGYCPPLRPVQILEYLVKRGSRRSIIGELKLRTPKINSLVPLHETIRRIKGCSSLSKKEHLISFLKDFLRYHRDKENGRLLKGAMKAITLVTDEKILLMSKKNLLLYDYSLAEEQVKEEKPIISHVILKADIRGSTDITHTMRARGLNPASYFSLNFFDPISEIICDYNASKVFIEGDAIILSIFENEDTAEGWYSVARACGLAVNMLHIVQQYNAKNQKHNLPILELGIGICYKQRPPAFLFDGNSRIMISSAINLADRMSACDKMLRKRFRNQDPLFNLFVFQDVRDEDVEASADDNSLRYNINGIELEQEGFAKLCKEINMKSIIYPMQDNKKATLYTGKVPTLSGHNQRLVIREAAILKIRLESLDVLGPTPRKYYEVCTHPEIYEFIDNHS